MSHRSFRTHLIWIIPVLFSLFIFSNSLQQGTSSGNLSAEIARFLMKFLPVHVSFDSFHHFVRKAAHFSEYFVLALTVCLSYHISKEKRNLPVFLFWFLVPSLDESIQHFVPGRYGCIQDVLLDMCGYGTCILLSFLLRKRRRHLSH